MANILGVRKEICLWLQIKARLYSRSGSWCIKYGWMYRRLSLQEFSCLHSFSAGGRDGSYQKLYWKEGRSVTRTVRRVIIGEIWAMHANFAGRSGKPGMTGCIPMWGTKISRCHALRVGGCLKWNLPLLLGSRFFADDTISNW